MGIEGEMSNKLTGIKTTVYQIYSWKRAEHRIQLILFGTGTRGQSSRVHNGKWKPCVRVLDCCKYVRAHPLALVPFDPSPFLSKMGENGMYTQIKKTVCTQMYSA